MELDNQVEPLHPSGLQRNLIFCFEAKNGTKLFNVEAGFMIEQQNLYIAGDYDGQKQIEHKKK